MHHFWFLRLVRLVGEHVLSTIVDTYLWKMVLGKDVKLRTIMFLVCLP